MATATLSSKGQITIPAPVREKLGLATGDRVEFVELPSGQFALHRAEAGEAAVGGGHAPHRGQARGRRKVIGLDTNVIVRYLTQDDPAQAALANSLMEETLSADNPGFVSTVALVETVWVLESGYQCGRDRIVAIMERLLRARSLSIEHADRAWQATRAYAQGKADFADCMIERAGHANGCDHTATFDRAAARSAGMRLLGK
jgi:AbrB family looped-hinge helix DNA binding protein